MKEKGFEKKVREFLKLQQDKYSIHILPKLEHTSIKLPDILFTIRGVLVAFELKVKKDYTIRANLQRQYLSQMQSKGCIARVVYPSDWNIVKTWFEDSGENERTLIEELLRWDLK